MAHILYSNNITEQYRPKNLVFTEEELLQLFEGFSEIQTYRLTTILNAWCIYGNNPNIIQDPLEYNRIGSDIIGKSIYSHILFVHDSELNLDWNVTDNILYKGYEEFSKELSKQIETSANNVLQEFQEQNGGAEFEMYLPQLNPIGTTKDKRVLFGFNPYEQTDAFYNHEDFYIFIKRVYEYIAKHKQQKEPFTIYEDKKAIIVVDTENVKQFLNSMLEKFKSKEDYEICNNITKIIDKWPPVKKTRVSKKTSTKK